MGVFESLDNFLYKIVVWIWVALNMGAMPQNGGWVSEGWKTQDNTPSGMLIYSASMKSQEIAEACRRNPLGFVKLPTGVLAAQEVWAGNRMILRVGDPEFLKPFNVFEGGYFSCLEVGDSKVVEWKVITDCLEAANIRRYPAIVSSEPMWGPLSGQFVYPMASGVLLMMGIFVLILFHGKTNPLHSIYVALAMIFYGIYFGSHTTLPRIFGFSYSQMYLVASLTTRIGNLFIVCCFGLREQIPKNLARINTLFVIVSAFVTLVVKDHSVMQATNMLTHPILSICLIFALFGVCRRAYQQGILYYVTIGSYLVALVLGLAEIQLLWSGIEIPSLLPIVMLALLFVQVLDINADVVATYKSKQKLFDDLQERMNQHKTMVRVTQGLAHDIRRPFSMVQVLLDLLKRVKTPEEFALVQGKYRGEIVQATSRVNSMLEDILDLSPVKRTNVAEFSLGDAVEGSLKTVFANRKESYAVRIRMEHEHCAVGDRMKIERVLANLFANAANAMKGAGSIEVLTSEKVGDVEVKVVNANSYIPPEKLEKIFEVFLTTERSGSGLGLSICKSLVESYGGRIWAESDPGLTTFAFSLRTGMTNDANVIASREYDSLRFGAELESRVIQETPLKRMLAARQEKFNVLIIEDEQLYVDLLRSYASAYGGALKVTVLKDVQSLAKIDDRIDLAICDVDLGSGQSGFDAVRQLRSAFPAVKICVHSNRGLFEYLSLAKDAGADTFLPKPMTEEHFAKLLWSCLENQA